MKSCLTPKQKKVLQYITEYKSAHAFAPSQQEIARKFGFKSLGTVQHYVVRLAKQGFLQKSWNARRGLQISNAANASPSTQSQMERGPSFALPLLGYVAAGLPIEAITKHNATINVPSFMIHDFGQHFALQVKGDSMIEEGIFEGDYVVFKKQDTAQNGQTVVALINNEATIKKYFKRKDTIELHPANTSYRPIIVESTSEFKIEGILAGVIRKIK